MTVTFPIIKLWEQAKNNKDMRGIIDGRTKVINILYGLMRELKLDFKIENHISEEELSLLLTDGRHLMLLFKDGCCRLRYKKFTTFVYNTPIEREACLMQIRKILLE